ncbi:MAG: V-type ATPase subunit [Anaerolineales bacterium]|nr:V-type ATPase subunit [Anaerolineales bacterium]
MPSGYDYGNARLRAMRSRLLTAADYYDLLAKATIEEVITALTETPYKEDIELALTRLVGVACVFEAMRANLTRTLRQLRDFFEGEPRRLVDLLLQRWDRHNLLTILRGQSQELTPETVLATVVPVGQLDEVSLRELARQPGFRAVIELMSTWRLPYAGALRRVQPRIGTLPDLDQLELALNRAHYASLQEQLHQGNGNKAIVLEQFQTEIDLANLLTGLRLVRRPDLVPLVQQRYNTGNGHPLFIEPGGHLPVQHLVELITQAGNLEGFVHGLNNTRYGAALAAGWQRYQAGEGRLAVFERELERWQAHQFVAMFNRNPLSIAVPMGYIGCKAIEVANLRLIAQAVALGLKRDDVRQELIIV